MKFQLALDLLTLSEAVAVAKTLQDGVDILEVGTPLLMDAGLQAVTCLHEQFPKHEILADTKIMDAGEIEAAKALAAGASIVTVCGAAGDATIEGVIRAARHCGGKVLVDMIAVSNLAERTAQLDKLRPDYIQVHTAFDGRAEKTPVADMLLVKPLLQYAMLAVAGGIGPQTIALVAAQSPELVVLGSQVLGSGNPRAVLESIRNSY